MNGVNNIHERHVIPHASAAYSDWIALQNRLRSRKHVLVNGRDLTVADVVAVSL
jgi:phenylalanine ammonia-lyase